MKTLKISAALNGWIVKAGCQNILFVDKKLMLKELGKYLSDPEKVEKEYMKKAVNKIPFVGQLPRVQNDEPVFRFLGTDPATTTVTLGTNNSS